MKPKRKNQSRTLTVAGIILPVEWDESGNVTGLAIHSYDEEKYQIDNLSERRELLSLLRERLKVTGILKRDDNGNRFTVKGYKLENPE